MYQAAETAGEPVADLAQGVRAAELAKQHRDELCPAGKALGSALAVMFLHQCGKLGPGKMLEQLIEQAGYLYDYLALLVGDGLAKVRPRNDSPTFIIGGLSFGLSHSRICLGQEWASISAKPA